MNMREIKFRLFDKEEKCYVEDLHHYWVGMNGNLYNDETDCCDMQDDFCIEQFTGLKDSEGREIHENDLVYVSGVGILQVKWDCCAYWGFINHSLEQEHHDYQDIIEDLETVVGNIHQNPELLERW